MSKCDLYIPESASTQRSTLTTAKLHSNMHAQPPTLALAALLTYRQKKHTQYGVLLGNTWRLDKYHLKGPLFNLVGN